MNPNQHSIKSKTTSSENYKSIQNVNMCIRDFTYENSDFDYIKAKYKLEVDFISIFIDKLNNGESLTEYEETALLESSLRLKRLEKQMLRKIEFNKGLIEGLHMELSELIHDRYGVWI